MPYNPGVQFDASIIERGAARNNALLGGIIDEFKQVKKQDKAAKAIFDALEPEEDGATGALQAHPLGLTKDAFNSLSSQDRIAKISGFVEAEAIKSARGKARREEARARLEQALGEQQLASGTRQNTADDALAAMMQSGRVPGAPAVATPGPFGGPVAPAQAPGFNLERALQSLPANPQAVNARGFANVDNLMRAAEQQRNPPALAFEEDPVSGTRFATFGNILSPSGVNPTRAGNAIAITGPGGEQLGMGLPTKSGVTPLQTGTVKDKDKYNRLTKQLGNFINAQGRVAYNKTAFDAYQSQIDELIPQIQELETGDAAPDVPASQNAPQASDISYLKAHPEMKAAFEKRFGAGSAAKHLK